MRQDGDRLGQLLEEGEGLGAQRDLRPVADVDGPVDVLQDLVEEQNKGLVGLQEVAQLLLAGRDTFLVVLAEGFVASLSANPKGDLALERAPGDAFGGVPFEGIPMIAGDGGETSL